MLLFIVNGIHKKLCLADKLLHLKSFCRATVPRACLMEGYVGICVSTNCGWRHLSQVLCIQLRVRKAKPWVPRSFCVQCSPTACRHMKNYSQFSVFAIFLSYGISISGRVVIFFYIFLSSEIKMREENTGFDMILQGLGCALKIKEHVQNLLSWMRVFVVEGGYENFSNVSLGFGYLDLVPGWWHTQICKANKSLIKSFVCPQS